MASSAHDHAHQRFVYGVTFENVREPRVNASALKRTTRTMTRKPRVATATKCPDSRIRTRPTTHAMPDTSTAAMIAARKKPRGSTLRRWSRRTPARHDTRFGTLLAFSRSGSVRIAEMYAPRDMNPMWLRENTPVKPLERFSA